jgi:hypothetical protein
MLAATQGMPVKPLPTAPLQAAASSPLQATAAPATLDQLFNRVAVPTGPPTPLIPVGTVLPPPRD